MSGCTCTYDIRKFRNRLRPICIILATVSVQIHARVDSREDVLTLHDQIARAARFSCKFYTAMVGNRNQGAYMLLTALIQKLTAKT